jgi:hypothetical protein
MKQKGPGQVKVTHGAEPPKAWVGPPHTHFTSPIVIHCCISSHPDSTTFFILLSLRSLFSCPALSYYSHSLQLSPFTPLDTVDALIPDRQHNPFSPSLDLTSHSQTVATNDQALPPRFSSAANLHQAHSASARVLSQPCKAGLPRLAPAFSISTPPRTNCSRVGIIYCTSHYFNSIQPSTII